MLNNSNAKVAVRLLSCFLGSHSYFCIRIIYATRILQATNKHYSDVMISAMESQITSITIVYSIVYSRRRSKKTLKLGVWAFVRGILHRWPVNSPHKGPVTWKCFHSIASSWEIINGPHYWSFVRGTTRDRRDSDWKIVSMSWRHHVEGRYTLRNRLILCRDHFVYAPSQWETTLQGNVVSH